MNYIQAKCYECAKDVKQVILEGYISVLKPICPQLQNFRLTNLSLD